MSTTVTGHEVPAPEIERAGVAGRGRRAGAAAAGPLLISASVLFALRGFAFRPLLTNRHVDLLGFWLPRFAYLGRTLASGHLPLWNPFEMAGFRFAADPQSGWLYVPAMLFFSLLSAGTGMRALIVFNPLLAGLGLYAFLRAEGLSRPAATVGGLALAMLMASSYMAISIPFAGFLAWTTVVLLGASGFRRTRHVSRRLAWLALSAFGWSQVASAHMSHGLVMSTMFVVAYLGVWALVEVRRGRLRPAPAAAWTIGFLSFLPLASLAILVPRLGFIGASSLQAGYTAVDATKGTPGIGAQAILTSGLWSGWPLTYSVTPGPYLGAVTLLAIPLAARARRWRPLVWAFGGAFALSYVLTLDALVSAGWFRALMLRLPFGDVYLHYPGRLWFLSMIAFPVLGAVGVQGLLDEPLPWRRLLRWLAPGAALFLAVPLVLGGHLVRYWVFAAIAPAAGLALARLGSRRGAVLLVGLLAADLLGNAVYANVYRGGTVFSGLETGHFPDQVIVPQPLRFPDLPELQFLAPKPFVDTLRQTQDRYLTWAPPAAYYQKGYLFTQKPTDWPALVMERGTLFGVHDVLGYNPVQLPRYWTYIRAVDRLSVFYNASVLNQPTLSDVRLLGVRYLIVPQGVTPALPGTVVSAGGGYQLVQLYGWEPRVSVVPTWKVVPGADALNEVRPQGFDPAATAVLERDPGITMDPEGRAGTATYSEVTPEDVRISVDAAAPSIVVIRNVYDPGWTATVDGGTAKVLAADYLDQGVAVPAGAHEIRLVYRDPAIRRGLIWSALVWFILVVAIASAAVVERRGRTITPPPDAGVGAP